MTTSSDDGGNSWFGWVVGTGAACAGVYVLALLLRDVFSVRGLVYTLGLGDGTGLLWPEATAALTWVLLVECCALTGVVGNYFAGRWKSSRLANLLLGHVAFVGWVFQALRAGCRVSGRAALWAVSRARRGPAVLVQAVPADEDFENVFIDDAEAA